MGSFFTNVQVKAGARSLGPLLEALRAEASMRELDPASAEEADRTVIVVPPDAGGWVTIYDDRGASQDGSHEGTAALASRALDAPAFSVLVHDSDVLYLSLYEHGVEVDRFDSFPGYHGEKVSKKERAAVEGKPEAWAALVVHGTVDELRAAWRSEELFAESMLARTCELLGCDRARAMTGIRYLQPGELPEGAVTLRFRSDTRPSYERGAEGLPRFEAQTPYGEHEMKLAVGDELRLGVTVRSAGGASKGLTIASWGSALDAGLVAIERFEPLIGNIRAGAKHEMIAPEQRDQLAVVDLPEREIPAGIAGGLAGAWSPGADPMRIMDAINGSNVHVNVVGRVLAPGRGKVSTSFAPHANREEGADGGTYVLAIDPAFDTPLRAALGDSPGGVSHLLRPLASDRHLVAMVAMDAPRAACAAIARAAIEDALEVLGTDGTVEVSSYRAAGKRPTSGHGKVTTKLRGKRFDTLVRSMIVESNFELRVLEGLRTEGPREARWGASIGTSVLGDREEERMPVLHLHADADALGDVALGALRTRWIARIEQAMANGGVQGALYRCGSTSGGVHQTAYEIACRTPNALETARVWITRFLRVPGNEITWLGPALAERLDQSARERLRAIADVDEGAVCRIALRDRASFRALEEALAALLPTAEQGREATDAWYGRARRGE